MSLTKEMKDSGESGKKEEVKAKVGGTTLVMF